MQEDFTNQGAKQLPVNVTETSRCFPKQGAWGD